jgi:hypothetical protein
VINHLIHTYGDLILIITDEQVRAYEVEADGSLTEKSLTFALALQESRVIAGNDRFLEPKGHVWHPLSRDRGGDR